MKKLLLLLLILSTPLFAQTEEPTQKKEMSPFLKKRVNRLGYDTLEELHQNSYVILSLGSTSVISSPYFATGISMNYGGLFHRKNKIYGVYLLNVEGLFGNQGAFLKIGYQMGIGISFYDSRDYKGSGWLTGFNTEFGVNYISSDYGYGTSYTAGVSLRGLYRNDYGIGVSLSLLVAYNYTGISDDGVYTGSHGFEIKPSLGFTY